MQITIYVDFFFYKIHKSRFRGGICGMAKNAPRLYLHNFSRRTVGYHAKVALFFVVITTIQGTEGHLFTSQYSHSLL